jgi:putative transposase
MSSKKLKAPLCPDKYYHIYNRGNNRERLFYHSGDYYFFLAKLRQYVVPFADIYAFCLLPNHFHILIKTRDEISNSKSVVPNQLRKLFISHTRRINYMQRRTGGLFTKNYQRIEIRDESYIKHVVKYIHKNPIKHRVYYDFEKYIYSSYHLILSHAKTHIKREDLIYWFGGKDEFIQFHLSESIDPNKLDLLKIKDDEDSI